MQKMPTSTMYLIKAIETAVRGQLEAALLEFGITPAQFLILSLLSENDGMSSADLARALAVRPQSARELLAPLESAGLIARREDQNNQRILRIRLTTKGAARFAAADAVAQELQVRLLGGLNDKEKSALDRTLIKLLQLLWAGEPARPVSSARRKA